MLWGESLFFASNGIAAGQAPIDAIKSISLPGVRASEVFRPVAQASVRFQPTARTTIGLYNQFEWRKNRLPGVASYFSAADFLDAGGEWIFVNPALFFTRRPSNDQNASDLGQFGGSLQYSGNDFDIGLYALRFHAKSPQIYIRPNPVVPTASQSLSRENSQDLSRQREGALLYDYSPGTIAGPGNAFSDIDLPPLIAGLAVLGHTIWSFRAVFKSMAPVSALISQIKALPGNCPFGVVCRW